jgi:hypothetical protein
VLITFLQPRARNGAQKPYDRLSGRLIPTIISMPENTGVVLTECAIFGEIIARQSGNGGRLERSFSRGKGQVRWATSATALLPCTSSRSGASVVSAGEQHEQGPGSPHLYFFGV